MDIEMPGKLDGIEAALVIKRERLETGVVILSAHRDRRYVTSLPLEASRGWAYLLKQSVPNVETVVRAISGCKAGMVVLDPAVIASLQPKPDSPVARLTPRQLEVLRLLAQGYKNAAIAEKLMLSEKTIETYLGAVYRELNLSHEKDIHARVKATLLYLEGSRDRK
jgi:DNA-binding NarL/FixJ family response regulator